MMTLPLLAILLPLLDGNQRPHLNPCVGNLTELGEAIFVYAKAISTWVEANRTGKSNEKNYKATRVSDICVIQLKREM